MTRRRVLGCTRRSDEAVMLVSRKPIDHDSSFLLRCRPQLISSSCTVLMSLIESSRSCPTFNAPLSVSRLMLCFLRLAHDLLGCSRPVQTRRNGSQLLTLGFCLHLRVSMHAAPNTLPQHNVALSQIRLCCLSFGQRVLVLTNAFV